MSLNIIKTELKFGLEKEIKLLHLTDTHISLADSRDDAVKRQLAVGRAREFDRGTDGQAERLWEEAVIHARENNMTIVHTGDLIDFLSYANLDFLDRAFGGVDYIYAAGNHDFCHFVGRAKEDAQYKRDSMKITAPHIKSNLTFDSKVIGGVNIVTLDNSYYLISDGQTEMLRAEAAKEFPILLFVHCPFFTKNHADFALENGNPCAYLCGAPREYTDKYSKERRLQQTPDHSTLRAIDYIYSEPLIKAVFAGHTHHNREETLPSGIMQYITGGTFFGDAREIILT